MLQIKPEQLEPFEDAAFLGFVRRLTEEVREIWAEESERIGHKKLEKAVADAAERGFDRGLETERDVARFVHLTVALEDPSFDEAPWADEVLGRGDMTPSKKMDLLWTLARDRLGAAGKDRP